MSKYKFKILAKDIIYNNIDEFTLSEFKKKLSEYDVCPRCKRNWNDIPILKNYSSPLAADFIIPLIKGGSRKIENVQPMCQRCHNKKINELIKKKEINDEKEYQKEANIALLKHGLKWTIILGIAYLILEKFGDKGLIIAGCFIAFVLIIMFLVQAPNTNSGNDGL